MDFKSKTKGLLKDVFGDTAGPITTSGQKILISQLLPDQLLERVGKELSSMYNEGWTDAMAFFANISPHAEQLLEMLDQAPIYEGPASYVKKSGTTPAQILITKMPLEPQ